MKSVFRPRFGQVLAVAIIVLCAAALVASTVHDGIHALWSIGPWMALVSLAVWSVYWNPRVVVDEGGVRLVNVLRTVDLPWPAIQRIDTKWSLTLFTAYGKYTAWAAPAPGGMARARANAARRGSRRSPVPEAARGFDQSLRAGDLATSPSGSAATVIRERFEALHSAGHLDDPKLESARPPITWHWPIIAGLLALIALTALTAT